MKIKHIILVLSLVFLIGILSLLFLLAYQPDIKVDIIKANDLVKTITYNWNNIINGQPLPKSDYSYTVLDDQNNIVAFTDSGLSGNINDAVRNRDTVMDIATNDMALGKVIIHNDIKNLWNNYRNYFVLLCIIFLIALTVMFLLYTLYLNRIILKPFEKMNKFAGHIAAGNLDAPLIMDKSNIFGAFTESFDLMRDELNKARENERKATQSKKELVALLSHDIKTPVASIRAVSELMAVTVDNEKQLKQIQTIVLKAEQIDSLITNLFYSTLEELDEMKVIVSEMSSLEIPEIIRNADYGNCIKNIDIPECMVIADKIRLQQVFDNIILNSYKYAGTDIKIDFNMEDKYLNICIRDFGEGVSDEFMPLIFNKYWRGENAEGKNGYGLGLYISKFLLNQMSGNIYAENVSNGFSVTVKLCLAGRVFKI